MFGAYAHERPAKTPRSLWMACVLITLTSCTRTVPETKPGAVRDVGDVTIRVLLSSGLATPRVASPGGLTLTNEESGFVGRAGRNETWRIERSGRRLRAVSGSGSDAPWIDGQLVVRPLDAALLTVGDKRYRGDVALSAGDSGIFVVNIVKIDDYLRGVVPLEIGTKATGDSAAIQAQAVAARSYAFIHLAPSRLYDVVASVADQVYGGADVETPVASAAVESTRTLVLKYAGRVVNAPYHSTCGGRTAAASEIWRSADEPYLQSVSDQIPGTGRSYCDIAPRFRWTRTLDADALNAALEQYLARYTSVPGRVLGAARAVTVASHTTSGRVGTLTFTTDRGNFLVRGNDIRFVLRPVGGEILNSTSFSVEPTTSAEGVLTRITIRGTGYGHGVGMCQWGAIGRARAGQDFGSILRAYYPGTTVGPAS